MSAETEATFGNCTYEEFNGHALEFFEYCKYSSEKQIVAGLKALNIFYSGLIYEHEYEKYQASLILELAIKKLK